LAVARACILFEGSGQDHPRTGRKLDGLSLVRYAHDMAGLRDVVGHHSVHGASEKCTRRV
jgi:hypothetical protein